MAVSAKTGRGLQAAGGRGALDLADRSAERIQTAGAQPLPRRRPGGPPAAGHARGKRLKIYYMAQFETSPPRVRDPGERPQPDHPRLRVLPREPAARAVRARGGAAGDRLQDQRRESRSNSRTDPCTLPRLMTTIAAFRQRVPVHLRVGHRGPPRQDRRPDLRRRPRRRAARGPGRPRGLRDAREHRARGRLRRDHDRAYVDVPKIARETIRKHRLRRRTSTASTATRAP